ncbi:UNVERIFIED_CONTAM: hypothetical protein Slati_2695600 [Sesamum latifolium]|uniref:Reverse transcriptase n=1 Tax=Sesamum latifolium TaxID=2727402 RepID=A0AAW2VX41_9LAMI
MRGHPGKRSTILNQALSSVGEFRKELRVGWGLAWWAHDRYLGLPVVAGRSKWALFQNIRDRSWDRISGWSSRLLSQASKGVLIKSVLQALPTYAMFCFKLPDHLLKDSEKTMRDFWWHDKGDKSALGCMEENVSISSRRGIRIS